MTNWQTVGAIDTLAAAYAENRNFSEAVRWQQKAISLAPANQQTDLRSRLSLYRSRRPYREGTKK